VICKDEVGKCFVFLNISILTSLYSTIDPSKRSTYISCGMSSEYGCFFGGRNRRPPTDPVNSMLSFGYTLLFNNVLSLTEGLHPYLGNLHRNDRTEPHLAFDLVEEFRSAIVDSLVMTLLNQGAVKPDDFQAPDAEGGVYLTDSGRRLFLKQFEARMEAEVSHPSVQSRVPYRYAIQLQIRRYLRCVMSSEAYMPFLRAV
jgi:CRISP-associated protein Cas1